MYGPQAAFIAEMFPTKVRYTGASMGYQLAGIFGGALAPIISVALLDRFDTSVVVSVYVLAMLLVTIICVFLSPETSKTDLHAEDVELARPSHDSDADRSEQRPWGRVRHLATGRRRGSARDRPVLPWLEQAVIDASAAALVCEAFETESVGGELTGMCPHCRRCAVVPPTVGGNRAHKAKPSWEAAATNPINQQRLDIGATAGA